MIHQLIQEILLLLREAYAGVMTAPEDRIVVGPIPEPAVGDVPMLVAYLDKLAISQNFKENGSSQPRPQEIREEIPVDSAAPAGPYPLAKTPLEKSVRCKIIFDAGTVAERQKTLLENEDFTILSQNATIVFSFDISEASTILLTYSFVGVFTLIEFEQEFLIDIYDSEMINIEKWGSLTTAIILTNHNELTESYNFTNTSRYVANQYLSTHTLDQINWLDGVPDTSRNVPKFQLKFQVQGQIKLVKEITDGFGLIEKIHSPGKISDPPIDIDIGVE